MQHYTNKSGYEGIGSQSDWRFLAGRPPGDHPIGAYFTSLGPDTRDLAQKLMIPRSKLMYRFEFSGDGGLQPLRGGRGAFVFYSSTDYVVTPLRQVYKGETGL